MPEGDFERENQRCQRLLQEHVVAAIPGFDAMSEQAKAIGLRDWVMANIPFGADDMNAFPFPHLLREALEKRLGFFCGGSTHILTTACNLLGIEAVSVNFGIPRKPSQNMNPPTHIVTAVRVREAEKTTILLLDGYLGIEYTDSSGALADLLAIIDAVRRNERTGYRARLAAGSRWKPFLGDPLQFRQFKAENIETIGGRRYIDFRYFQDVAASSFFDKLHRLTGRSHDWLDLLLMPFGVYAGPASLQKTLAEFFLEKLDIDVMAEGSASGK